jgi:hypothetical protein
MLWEHLQARTPAPKRGRRRPGRPPSVLWDVDMPRIAPPYGPSAGEQQTPAAGQPAAQGQHASADCPDCAAPPPWDSLSM